jgi:hypothetical protein
MPARSLFYEIHTVLSVQLSNGVERRLTKRLIYTCLVPLEKKLIPFVWTPIVVDDQSKITVFGRRFHTPNVEYG